MAAKDAYNLDDVANVEHHGEEWGSQFPMKKGDTSLDNVESVATDAKMTYRADDAFPTGGANPGLDAITDLPMGTGAEATYAGGTGHVKHWPKAFED